MANESTQTAYMRSQVYTVIPETKRTDQLGSIYIHKNDPKVVNKGLYMTNVRQAQGGYVPMLADSDYNLRKFNNTDYNYNARTDHGTRPMHKTTFSLGYQPEETNFTTKHKTDYQGFRLRPEYIPVTSKNQFEHHFDIGLNDKFDAKTHYESQYYFKNNDKGYVSDFDVMPKYSVGKQLNQLVKDNKVKEYNNRTSKIKEALVIDTQPNFWTQYKRTHDYLGHLRGDGVPKEYPEKDYYNVLTGEKISKSLNSLAHKRVSGDLKLSHSRLMENQNIIN